MPTGEDMAVDPFSPEIRSQRRAAFRLVVVAAVILIMTLSGKRARERTAARTQELSHLVAQGADQARSQPDPGPRSFQAGSRTRVPRPVATRTAPDAVSFLQGPAALREEWADTGDVDLKFALSASLEAVVPDVKNCLHAWWMIDPKLAGTLEVAFVLDQNGLGEVEILDHTDVPMGPLSCFATALYDAHWPRVDSEIRVVQPFRFEQ
jgi:hypothetical protein